MTDVAIDTLAIARNLEAAGIERRQAEAHAEALRLVADASRGELATKADLRAEIAAFEARFTRRLYGVVIANGLFAAAIVAAIKLLP